MNTERKLSVVTEESGSSSDKIILFPGDKICRVCGQSFHPSSTRQSVCYRKHLRTCVICGKTFELNRRQLNSSKIRKTCSDKCQYLLANDTKIEKYGVVVPEYEDTKAKRQATRAKHSKFHEEINSHDFVEFNQDEVQLSSQEPQQLAKHKVSKKLKKSILRKRIAKKIARGEIPANLSDEELDKYIEEHYPEMKLHHDISSSNVDSSKSSETRDFFQEGIQILASILNTRMNEEMNRLYNLEKQSKEVSINTKVVEVLPEPRKLKRKDSRLKFSSEEERSEFYNLVLNDVLERLDSLIPEEYLSLEEQVAVYKNKICEFCHVPFAAKSITSTVCYNKHIFRCNVCGKLFEESTRSLDPKVRRKKANLFCSTKCKREAEQGKEYKLICLGSYNTKDI